ASCNRNNLATRREASAATAVRAECTTTGNAACLTRSHPRSIVAGKIPSVPVIAAAQRKGWVRHLKRLSQARCYNGLRAPVAQLDRASGYEPEGRVFESLRAHHKNQRL